MFERIRKRQNETTDHDHFHPGRYYCAGQYRPPAMSGKMIALTDYRDQVTYFTPESLNAQLFETGAIEMSGAVKSAAINLAKQVQEMMDWQHRFFSAPHGSPEKARALTESKRLEKQVWELIPKYLRTVPQL